MKLKSDSKKDSLVVCKCPYRAFTVTQQKHREQLELPVAPFNKLALRHYHKLF